MALIRNAGTTQQSAEELVQRLLEDAAITISTTTKAGWCLRTGLIHVVTADDGRLFNLVQSQGPPSLYRSLVSCRHENHSNAKDDDDASTKAPENCFQSLCRIVAGQQLAGNAARAIWKRLLETTNYNLSPKTILSLTGEDGKNLEVALQKPAGLSRAKARSIHGLAQKFDSKEITDEFLIDPEKTEEEIRETLLKVRGLGPWSCDMFIMFYLEKPNVFPFGDLGVRKGITKFFQVKGKGKQGSLCQQKDFDKVKALVAPYHPYQSLFTYYMWRVADIKDVYAGVSKTSETCAKSPRMTTKDSLVGEATPSRKRKARVITP